MPESTRLDEVRHGVGRVVVEQLEFHLAQVGDDLQDLVGLRHEGCRQVVAGVSRGGHA